MILCSETAVGLQNLINGLHESCKKWHLIVSLTKTNVVVFGKGQNVNNFQYGDDTIETAKEYKYLGTIFTNENIFKKNLLYFADKARNAITHAKSAVGHLQPVWL